MTPAIDNTLREASAGYAGPIVPLGEYLFRRLSVARPSMKTIFGIAGDFNLNLMEHLYAPEVEKNLRLVGGCNELNAGYTADGYAAISGGISALISTYGVGETSALNAMCGAFAEYRPVLHIVGTTSAVAQEAAAVITDPMLVQNIHHLVQSKNPLQSPDHDVYKKMAAAISVAQETLVANDAAANVAKIDRVIKAIMRESRPGFLYVPSDITNDPIPEEMLALPFDSLELRDQIALDKMADRILAKIYAAKKPSVLSDALTARFGHKKALDALVEKLPASFFRLFSTNTDRSIDESLPNFVGVYIGRGLSVEKQISDELLDLDLILNVGYMNCDTNTFGPGWNFPVDEYVEVHTDYVKIDGEYVHYKDQVSGERLFLIGDLLKSLSTKFDASKLVHNGPGVNNVGYTYQPPIFFDPKDPNAGVITQTKLVDFFNGYLRKDDILVMDTTSFLFSAADLRLAQGVTALTQMFYASIGFALPAMVGAALAVKDQGSNRRILLVQGDGLAQMTVQELSTLLRYEIQPPKIFLMNNEGYTIERGIKGPTRSYNDIQDQWRWRELFKVFGDVDEKKHRSLLLVNGDELDAFREKELKNDKIEMIELRMAKFDYLRRVKVLTGITPPATKK